MARRDQFGRCFRLLRLLGRAGGASLPELVDELAVARRTVYRDLESLQDCGVPIFEDSDVWPKRWHVRPEYLAKAALEPTFDELLALHALRSEMADAAEGVFAEPVESMLAKVRSAVPAALLKRADALRPRLARAPRPSRAKAPASVATTLLAAVESSEVLRLDYRSRSARGRAWREVEPYGLAVRGQGLYLLARDVLGGDVRKYLVLRIEGASRAGRTFTRPASFDVEDFFGDAFGVHGGDAVRVVVRFDAVAAPFVRERRWHPSQALSEQADGGLVLTMRVSGMPEVKSWVQSFGATATVLEPLTLADDVYRDAVQVATRVAKRGAGSTAVAMLASGTRSTGRRVSGK